jgi:uncharacterized coiled-coil DUF342 family protein
MKKYTRILSYVAVILVLFALYYRTVNKKTADLNHKIEMLEKQSDSLQHHIDSNNQKIVKLDSIAMMYKNQVTNEKQKLAGLQSKADLYKQKYNEEHNRISKLSNDALVSEFTNAFD